MGKKLTISCLRCTSQKVVLNGHYHKGMPQFFCTNCHKYFYENSAKGYPPTAVPFPIIAYFLYFRKRIPAFSNMREFRRFVSQWLKCLGIRDTDIDRHTIRHWIKNYERDLEKIISFQEARDYVHNILSEKLKKVPKEIIKEKTHPYKQTLHFLEQTLGRRFCVELARNDPDFFSELTDIASKYKVYCIRVSEEEQFGRPARGVFFSGVVQ